MVLTPDADAEVTTLLNTTRIIVFAMIAGVLAFAGYLLFMHKPAAPANANGGDSPLVLMMFALAVMGIGARVFIPNLVVRVHRRKILDGSIPPGPQGGVQVKTEAGWLAQGYQTTTIIAGALLEGPTFANLYAYMQEQQIYSLIIGGILLLGMIALFPPRSRIENWLNNQLRLLDEERSLASLDQ